MDNVSARTVADLSMTRRLMSPTPRPRTFSLAEIARDTMEPWTRMYADYFGEYGAGMVTSDRR